MIFFTIKVKSRESFSQERYMTDASLGFKCEYTKKLGKCFFPSLECKVILFMLPNADNVINFRNK